MSGLLLWSSLARADDLPATQTELGKSRLGNSTPLINQATPVTVHDSFRAAEAAEAAKSGPSDDDFDASGMLLGDPWGARSWLARHGITLDIQEVDEVWGNPTGGTPSAADGNPAWGGDGSGSGTGAAYDGMTMPTLQVDTEKLFGLHGGLFNVSALQLRGRSMSQDHLAMFNPASGFEADRSTRLFELWYQQSFLHDKLDVKIGQMDLDTEFLISDYGALYLNANFGWPMAPSVNLYAGGPSWPLAAPAVRIRYRPTDDFTILFAAADDNPPGNRKNSFGIQNGGNSADPTNQNTNNADGANFNMGTGALLITELQYATSLGGSDDGHGHKAEGLPGVYKLGGYYDTAKFPSYRYNNLGQPLGSAADTTGIPKWKRGNWMIYGIVDQMIWRPSADSPQSLAVFARATGNSGDRNLISFAVDAGVNFKAPFKSRVNDTFGVGWGIGRPTYGQRGYDRRSGAMVQRNENHVEVTYQAQVTPWWVLQPDFQYIWRPGGGMQDYGSAKYRRVRDEAILGLHSSINF